MEGPILKPRLTTLFFTDHRSRLALAAVWHPVNAVMPKEPTERLAALAAQNDNTTAIQVYALSRIAVFQDKYGRINRDGVCKGIKWTAMLLHRLGKAGFSLAEPVSGKHVRLEFCWQFDVEDMWQHARGEREQRNNMFMYNTVPMTGCENAYKTFRAQLEQNFRSTPIVDRQDRAIEKEWFAQFVKNVPRKPDASVGLEAKAPQTKLINGREISLGGALNPVINYAHPLIPTSIWKGRKQPYYHYFVLLPDDQWNDAGVFVVRYGLDRDNGSGKQIVWEKCSVRDDNKVVDEKGERVVRGLADVLVELLNLEVR